MKKFSLFAFLLAIFTSQSLVVSAQTNKKAEIKRIDAYVKTVDAFVEKNKSPHLIFADISDYEDNSKPKWRKFASKNALEKFRETSETYTMANNWRRNGKIVTSVFTLFSPSGDWAKYIYLYFREDGTLAKSEIDYRSFYGDLIILKKFYFGGKGNLLKKTTAYKDLRTREPKQPDEFFLEANSALMNETNYYKKTSKLPFASLLKKKRK